ncbi:MAG: nuclear transport factor 2 family protein [Sphingobium sp.]|nr:nuclear transport factor 2 family protein [Sphingobium sp.]MCP5400113.1 nuclear transport factor 2 family protein [Sphingomonas sp.]
MSVSTTALQADGPAIGEKDWPAAFFRDADQLDLAKLLNWFTDDVDLRLGNMPPIIGRQGAEEAFRQFWSTLTGMSHERQQLVLEGNCAFQGSIVTYTRLDGKKVSMPVASHLRLTPEGRSDRLWIYIDLAPLYSED